MRYPIEEGDEIKLFFQKGDISTRYNINWFHLNHKTYEDVFKE